MTSPLFALIRDQTLPASLSKLNANGGGGGTKMAAHWARLWDPHADYLPVDLLLIIIRVYKLSSPGRWEGGGGGGLQSQLHTRWANRGYSSEREWTWIYSWCKEPPTTGPLRLRLGLPREQTFMKTFPSNHYNSISIPGSRYLCHDCICCSSNLPS